jgi:HD-like signal output (HDOD) protein
MEEAARLISKDQALSADVLRRANCAAMVTVNQAGTLNEALTRLGVRGIRSTMIRQSMQSITLAIQDRQSVAHQLWRASRASACCTAIFAECFNVEFEDAYLAGLLHDLGQILILKMQSDIERSAQTKIPDVVYRFLCQEHHEAIGFRLAAQWCLPEEVTELVATHHSPLVSEDPRQNQRAVIQLVDATLSLLKYKPYVPFSLLTMPAAIHLKAADNPQFTSMLDTLPETISQMLASD